MTDQDQAKELKGGPLKTPGAALKTSAAGPRAQRKVGGGAQHLVPLCHQGALKNAHWICDPTLLCLIAI